VESTIVFATQVLRGLVELLERESVKVLSIFINGAFRVIHLSRVLANGIVLALTLEKLALGWHDLAWGHTSAVLVHLCGHAKSAVRVLLRGRHIIVVELLVLEVLALFLNLSDAAALLSTHRAVHGHLLALHFRS